MPDVESSAYKDSVFANCLYVVNSRFVELYLRQTPRGQLGRTGTPSADRSSPHLSWPLPVADTRSRLRFWSERRVAGAEVGGETGHDEEEARL